MKKVLFVATVVRSHINVFHLPFIQWFKNNDYETYVCAKNDYVNKEECIIPYCDKYYDVPFERSPFSPRNFSAYRSLKKLITNNDFDIIHCHTPVGATLARIASRRARKSGTKVYYTAHGFHFFKGAPLKNWLIFYPIEFLLSKFTDVIITINKEDYSRAKKFLCDRVEYVPGVGLDTSKYLQQKINSHEKRKELEAKDDEFLLLSVGELNTNKNHEKVIRALKEINDDKIRYIICGDGELMHYLSELINELSMESQIKLLGYRRDINEIMESSNAFIFPSYREGLPVSIMEAMASGLPVICSNIRGNIDLIDDELGGYYFNPSDVNSIKEAIEKLRKNRKINNMGIYNKKKSKEYDLNSILLKMKKIYAR